MLFYLHDDKLTSSQINEKNKLLSAIKELFDGIKLNQYIENNELLINKQHISEELEQLEQYIKDYKCK
jgi:predicted RNA binding protein with dsRBD fold (UPF0201 family)